MQRLVVSAVSAALIAACGGAPTPTPSPQPAPEPAPVAERPKMERLLFNRRAAEHAVPLFWSADTDADGMVDPDELVVTWELEPSPRTDWVVDGKFTPKFDAIYTQMQSAPAIPAEADETERKRREQMLQALAAGRRTLIVSDFTQASEEDRAIVEHIVRAATLIDNLFAQQKGLDGMREQIPADDTASRYVFHRNQGPWCVSPGLDKDPQCSTLASRPKEISGLYPIGLQADPDFCKTIAARPDQKILMSPFTVVVQEGEELKAVPFTEHFAPGMKAVSDELKAAAAAIVDPAEAAFKTYLEAAAQGFVDNNWEPVDEAWAAMNVHNSKWFLRIAPDEVYFEPCAAKAGFHVSFARINQDSLRWQSKLDPLKTEMEQVIAELAGAPYEARTVDFHLPDFIDIVLNAGDSRSPFGATVGQSLPNWGPVANEGRGRTVAMTNLYSDPDSQAAARVQTRSLLCPSAMVHYSDDAEPMTMSTVLHEAAHNLGPAHEYEVDGKTAREIFGGPMASTMEELKAQTAALYYADWLADKGVIDAGLRDRSHVRDILWAFGHISRGMYANEGRPRPYSQLAAIQTGYMFEHGALNWRAEQTADNATDKGCFEIDLPKMSALSSDLMKTVARIKGGGDKDAALELKKKYVDDEGQWSSLRDTIRERFLRTPKASFIYSIRR